MILTLSLSFGQKERGESEREKLTATEKAEKRTNKLVDLLTLSEDQKEKVYQINLNHIEKMEAIKVEKDALREKIKSAHDIAKSEMDAILTSDQKTILDEKREEMKKKRKEKREKCQHEHKE